jgi:8-oxo-dGTP pyrophosphatase MutT (NUDIX family)
MHNMNTKSSCKLPITSIGIIHVNRQGKYLMICRKNTLGYVDIVRGRYSVYNPNYLKNLVDELTVDEKQLLLQNPAAELCDEDYARDKLETIKKGVIVNNEFVCLRKFVVESPTQWQVPEWGFPKGRRNTYESDLNCALREYEEETGFAKHDLKLIHNLLPYEEVFIGSNLKSYKHKYFVGFGDAPAKHHFQESEVSDMAWFTYEEALAVIRPYNNERKNLLACVDKMLREFFSHPF